MITGLSLFQLLQGPVNTEANGAGAASADNGATPFAGLLGSLLGTGTAGTAGTTASTSSSPASNLPAELQASLRALLIGANLSQSLSPQSPDQPAAAGNVEEAVKLLEGFTDGQLIPLNIIFNLQGQDAVLGGEQAIILVRESDLRQLLNGGGLEGSGFSIPVLAMLGGTGESNAPLSLTPATLTASLGQAEGASVSGAEKPSAIELMLTLVPPAPLIENADTAAQSVAESNLSISADALIRALDRLTELLKAKIGQPVGQQTLTGLTAPGENSAQAAPASASETGTAVEAIPGTETVLDTVSVEKTDNTNNVKITETPAVAPGTDAAGGAGIDAVRKALYALLDKLTGTPDQTALLVKNQSSDKENAGLKQATLQVLTDILKNAITRAADSGDSGELRNTLALLDRLARFEQLTAGEQKNTLESLLKANDQLNPTASSEAAAPQAAQLSISATPPSGWNDTAAAESLYGAALKDQAGNIIAEQDTAAGSPDSAAALLARLLGDAPVISAGAAGNDAPAETSPAGSFARSMQDSGGKLEQASGAGQGSASGTAAQDPNSAALSQAARAILSFIASVTGANRPAEEGAADSRSSGNTAKAFDLLTPPAGRLSSPLIVNAGLTSQSPAAQSSMVTPEAGSVPLPADAAAPASGTDTQPLSDAAGKNNRSIDRGAESSRPTAVDQPGPGVNRNNENPESRRLPVSLFQTANTALIESGQTGKDSVEGSKITVQVSLAPAEAKKLSSHPLDSRAAVDYVKIGGDNSGSSSKEAPVAVQNILNATLEDLVESWLKAGAKDELSGKIKGGELAGEMKNEQIHNSFRNELNTVRGADQKADQAQHPRSAWPTNQLEVLEKIANAARLTRAGGTSEISLRLQPEELGLMRVRLSVDNQHVLSARIQVETHEARSIIESSLHQLKESLAQQGLKVEKLNVDVRQDQDQNQNPYQTAAGKDGGYNSRARNGFLPGQPGDSFAPASSDYPDGALTSVTPLHKYSYSTLEWVA